MRQLDGPPLPDGDFFDGGLLESLEALGRIERHDVDSEGYRLRLTALGRLAVRLWPATAISPSIERPSG